jgi:RimJ/RimL family protein N-acetyltransferase
VSPPDCPKGEHRNAKHAGTPVSTVLHGPRVTLRPWREDDLAPFAALNDDREVMRHLSGRLSRHESDAFVQRIRDHFASHGFGLWALDVPLLGFAGFIGLSARVPFAPAVPGIVPNPHEIGWRLARAAWGHGYATEGALLALRHGFDVLRLPQIVSFTVPANRTSQAVMQRIGLSLRGEFDHPRFAAGHPLRRHLLYAADAPSQAADKAQ